LYQHFNGILMFLWNTAVLYNMTQIFKKQVNKREHREVYVIFGIMGTLLAHIFATYFFFREENLWKSLLLIVSSKETKGIWDIFWIITTNDIMVRFCSMVIKCCIFLAIGHKPPFKRLATLFTLVETFSQLYRMLLPLPLWFLYFIHENNGQVFSGLISGLYLALKGNRIVDKLKIFGAIFKAWLMGELQYGKYATQEQIMESGDLCAICQEKMTSPIILRCNHIFCEDCVGEWFERENTCPLCRAEISSAGNRTHSDGSTSMFVELF